MEEEYVVGIDYIQAPTLKELAKKVNTKIEKEYATVEQNPFYDETTKNWTQMIVWYESEEEED